MRFHPPFPLFPPVPTAPMDPASLGELQDALQACKGKMSWPEFLLHVQNGYARVWIHLALERGLDPRKILGAANQGHQVVLTAWIDAGKRVGIHDRVSLAWYAPEVAALACRLWTAAKAKQGPGLAPQLDLGDSPLFSTEIL